MMNVDGLRQRCRISSNTNEDNFVGIKSDGNNIIINFPLGYYLPTNENELRSDVINLISVLTKFSNNKAGELPISVNYETVNSKYPLHAYLKIISHFMSNGYYMESEDLYRKGTKGKINWSRTIKSIKPVVQPNAFVYLDFLVRSKNQIDDNLITKIHQLCVYESFQQLGWLFTSFIPERPNLSFNEKLFLNTIYNRIEKTFNSKNKELFFSMISIIKFEGQKSNNSRMFVGTYKFEYVWEKLIDYTYGIPNKEDYFPKSKWNLENGISRENTALEPDSIMVIDNKVFVLDAKYYKYGLTKNIYHLPQSSSINKQVTYGEFIAYNEKFKSIHGENFSVYNAFLLPFNMYDDIFNTNSSLHYIGHASADWKSGGKSYESIQGILVDIRSLMHNYIKVNSQEIHKLSLLIENSLGQDKPRNT